MDRLLLVCLGSALGGALRYAASLLAVRLFGPAFPLGTLAVNLAGCFLIALVLELATATTWVSAHARVFLVTGVMGGLTTYSSFNEETLALWRQGDLALATLNLGVTIVGCVVFGVLGFATGRALAAP